MSLRPGTVLQMLPLPDLFTSERRVRAMQDNEILSKTNTLGRLFATTVKKMSLTLKALCTKRPSGRCRLRRAASSRYLDDGHMELLMI